MAAPEGYLLKKPQSSYRWLKRYYAWDPEAKRLNYWKGKKEKDANHLPKGSFLQQDLLRVWHPDPSKLILFNVEFKDKFLAMKAETSREAEIWVKYLKPLASQKASADESKNYVSDEETANWPTEKILEMMAGGQVMTAYFQNETKKNFMLYCQDLTLYACPVTAGIEKAIISLPLRRISDIYVGKQTPGFDTDIAFAVPFDRCFTIISRKYTLDVEAKSAIMATHWLAGIKYLLTQSGKAVIVNEQEGLEGEEEQQQHHEEPQQHHEEPHQSEAAESAAIEAAEKAGAAIAAATQIPHAGDHDEDLQLNLEDEEPAEQRIRKTALIIVDMQVDLLPGGPIPTKDADQIIPVINKLRKRCIFDLVILTSNHRPENHVSFFINNKDKPGAQLGRAIEIDGRQQILWPQNCIAGSEGSAIVNTLVTEESDVYIKKATTAMADTYSAFQDTDKKTETELLSTLVDNGIDDIFVTGIGFDTVVGCTALDGTAHKFNVYVVEDATKPLTSIEAAKKMKKQLRAAGVPIITTQDVPDDSLMPDAVINEARENMEMDDEVDSDDDAAAAGKPVKALDVADFLSEDFLAVMSVDGGAEHEEEEDHEDHHEEQVKDVAADGAKKGAKKGSKKAAGGAAAKKGSKKAAGVRITTGTKKTASGKVTSAGTRSKAAAKKGVKKGSKKAGAASKKPASKKAAAKKPAAKKPAAKKPASKKPASKKAA
eukprot:gb/GEZN01002240.1/.p1 GENE.gb/GEZN01002240.1/~~gb/GEZN01002240.1/.p1  ORF type:complete len:714 (-),score=185.18 gb/GEZN01002240.1/:350-2491(-)